MDQRSGRSADRHVGCAPAGSTPIPLGGTCATPVAGPIGFDDCAKGTFCFSGVCEQICDLSGNAPRCDSEHACASHNDLFETGGAPIAGVCDPACDPLTQEVVIGTSRTACGSTNPSMPDMGCFGFSDFTCLPSSAGAWERTDRQPPSVNAGGNPYTNGCAPGFMPLLFENTGSTKMLCTGLCAALEIDNTKPASNAKGDGSASGKLPRDSASVANMRNATCDAGKKGSEDSSQCIFLWKYLVDDTTHELPPAFETSPHRDTLGICLAYDHYQYDTNNDQIPDQAYPDCTTLPPRSSATPGEFDDAADWGCQLREHSLSSEERPINRSLPGIRAPTLSTAVQRHPIE